MNISSIVVQAKSENIEKLVQFFSNCDFCEYHFSDIEKGKIILTIQGEGVSEEIRMLKKIQQTSHVVSADMMMSYSEEELDMQRQNLQIQDIVPTILKDDNIKAEDIVYHGDLKKKNIC